MRTEFHLFGGQGSSGIFNDASLAVVRQDARTCQAAHDLLAGCHSTLMQICGLLFFEDESTLQIIQLLPTADSLLSPPVKLQSTPEIQAATLCLYQLLRFLSNAMKHPSYEKAHSHIHETLGFSSGILPAVIVAASPTLDTFIKNGVQAFSAAFCIGRQARLCSHTLSPEEGPWACAIIGPSLDHHNVSRQVAAFNMKGGIPITVASIIRESHLTLSGPKSLLEDFMQHLPENTQARFVQVNAMYHGGDQMKPAVNAVLTDFRKLDITLPPTTDFAFGVRDSTDGSVVSSETSRDPTGPHVICRWVVEGLLVKPINWSLTLDSMARDMNQLACHDIDTAKAVSYGPFSSIIIADLHASADITLEKINLSHDSLEVQAAANYEFRASDIAIIGVGLEFPNGSNIESFWQALLDGKSFVREVWSAFPPSSQTLIKTL